MNAKISLDNSPYVSRETGKPIEGRLTIYEHNSNVLAKTYTLEATSYRRAANPVLIHGGYTDDTLFLELGLYDLKIEKYTGPEGSMSVESEDFATESYQEFGLDSGIFGGTETTVDTIAELKASDPDLHAITVLGYNEVGDTSPRIYVWDEESTDENDGGFVVSSDQSDTGRWILLWGDDTLPASVYGVFPGEESNINLLLSYPETVGSFALKTPKKVRFSPGTYTAGLIYATEKELVFDSGATFPDGAFQCPRISVNGELSSAIADFVFTSPDFEAHSSWFFTLQSFYQCGTKLLRFDTVNHFTDTLIRGAINLDGLVLIGTSRLPNSYASGAYFIVTTNTVIEGRIFSTSLDYVQISGGMGDKIFSLAGTWDPGLISAGHHVYYQSVPDLDLFENTDRWVKTMVERRERLPAVVWNDFTLDLQNRRLDNLNPGKFTEIRNGTFNRLTINNGSADITLRNVSSSDFTLYCRYLTAYDSQLDFQSLPGLSAFWGYDCRLNSHFPWRDPSVQVELENCYVGITFNRVTDNTSSEAMLKFTDCTFQTNVAIYTKSLYMYRCKTDNNTIKIYPYKDSSNVYHFRVSLEGNIFNNSNPIEFTRIEEIGGRWQEDVYDILLNWNIVGNMFTGNDEGLRMRYWQKRGGQYYTRTFVKMGSGHSVVYSGNMGKCPAEDMHGVSVADNKAYTTESVSTLTLYKYTGSWKRTMPYLSSNVQWWNASTIGGPNTCIKWYSWVNSPYNSLTYDLFIQSAAMLYFAAHDEVVNDGDFFRLALATVNDYIRIVQRGDGDRNDGVVARII